jgi:uncharacterized protein YifN (PemK superfamily)
MFEIMNENVHSVVLESTVHKASRCNWVMADVIYTFSLNRLADCGSYFQYFCRLPTLVVEFDIDL